MTNSDRRFVLMALVRLRLLLAHHEIQVPRPTVQVYAHAMRILSKERKLEAAAYRHTEPVVGGGE